MAERLPEFLQLILISRSIKLGQPVPVTIPDLMIFLTDPGGIKQVITGVSGHFVTKNTDIFLVNVLLLYLLYDET